MMKSFFILATALITSFTSYSQDFPGYGVITPQEFMLKECSFDKEANAVVLLDEGIANNDEYDYSLVESRHIRIKILKESGYNYANIEIPFIRKDKQQFISDVEAIVTNIDENGNPEVTKVSKKSFYKKDENEIWGNFIFTFPNIKVGSIIEYKYIKKSLHYGYLDDWNFHSYLPTIKSAFKLYVPLRLEFTYQVLKSNAFPITVKKDENNATVYFEMNNIPGLEDEAYMDARKDYIQKVAFQISGVNRYNSGFQKTNTTWNDVINTFITSSNFGTQLRKKLSGTDAFIETVKKIPSNAAKVKAVYNYVRENMSWNGFYSRATEGIKDAWNKKSGSDGEINLILINLLRDVDVDASPLLVSERWHGKVNITYPFIDQFNTCYAYAEVDGKKYYLDAAHKNTPPEMIPERILNTTGLLVNRKKGGLMNITSNNLSFNEFINVMMTVDSQGGITGDAAVKSDGYARVEKFSFLKDNGDQKFIDRYYKNEDFTIDSFACTNKDIDSLGLEQGLKFSGNLKASSGEYYFLPLNHFIGFQKNPFISQERFSDVNFGYQRKINTYCNIQLPAAFVLDELPKAVRMVTPDKDITFTRNTEYNKEENSVTVIYTFDFTKSTYTVSEYDVLQQVYKKMFDFLKEPLVLKKK